MFGGRWADVDPGVVRSYDELTQRLRALRSEAGVSYRELHRGVVAVRRKRGIAELPARDTVHRCLQPGRTRLDVDLVADIARTLTGSDDQAEQWRRACQVIAGEVTEAQVVDVATTLPLDTKGFVGRESQARQLLESRSSAYAIVGMPGVGKTALAVHVAQQHYADRELLFVNLRGFDIDHPPADPAAVLDGFLRHLGLPGDRIACMGLERRAAAYRELLRDRRTIVVLDNAADAEQVRPLLPDIPSCRVLITSRRPIDLPGVESIALDVMTAVEATELLGSDAELAGEIVELVGRLPLSLALMAARISRSPDWTLADHVARLREHRTSLRLDAEVELAIASSYESLSAECRRMFRLLALHPGRLVDVYAAAALADVEVETAAMQVRGLVDAALLKLTSDGYHEFHDLVLAYAQHQLREEEPHSRQDEARNRLFGHYVNAVEQAKARYTPDHPMIASSAAELPCTRIGFADRDSAVRWLTAERANLIAVVDAAASHGQAEVARDIPLSLFNYQWDRSLLSDNEAMCLRACEVLGEADTGRLLSGLTTTYVRMGRVRAAVDVGRRAVDILEHSSERPRTAAALGNLASAYFLMGRWSAAMDCWEQARAIFVESEYRRHEGFSLTNLAVGHLCLGNPGQAAESARHAMEIAREGDDETRQATVLVIIGWADEQRGDLEQAVTHLREAVELARRDGNRFTESDALNHLGTALARNGQLDEALGHHQRALVIARDSGDRPIELEVLNDLAATLRRQGDFTPSLSHNEEALSLAIDLGVVYQEARAHDGLAEAYAAMHEPDRAILHWKKALAIHEEIGAPDAEEIRARLG